jgi:hypothetical protein
VRWCDISSIALLSHPKYAENQELLNTEVILAFKGKIRVGSQAALL